MIARAFIGQDPFEVWGDGKQIRNWTYIDDIVGGTILAGEKIDDGTAVNLGTMERIRVIDAVTWFCEFTWHKAKIKPRPEMPTGPLNRVADNALAKRLLGWEPKVPFPRGPETHHRLVFRHQRSRRSAAHLRPHANRTLIFTASRLRAPGA